jgi:Asp-tRNA(Asn)/Glu-tRNA(Gln) amidotransferase A subunit family amidase
MNPQQYFFPAIKAWLHVDKASVIAAARERDKYPDKGPLHGIPFGVKDMIDTADMPTTYSTHLAEAGYRFDSIDRALVPG